MLNELGIRDPVSNNIPSQLEGSASTYTRVSITLDVIVNEHHSYLSKTFPFLPLMSGLPFLMWISKMHKTLLLSVLSLFPLVVRLNPDQC